MISNLIVLHSLLAVFLLPAWIYYFKVTEKEGSDCESSKKEKRFSKKSLWIWTGFVLLIYTLGMIFTFV